MLYTSLTKARKPHRSTRPPKFLEKPSRTSGRAIGIQCRVSSRRDSLPQRTRMLSTLLNGSMNQPRSSSPAGGHRQTESSSRNTGGCSASSVS